MLATEELQGKGWRLRNGHIADILAMYDLDLVCFEGPFRFNFQMMDEGVRRPGAVVVVAHQAEVLVGFVIVHLESEGVAYVVTLNVAPEVRRRGLAHDLLAEAERQAMEQDAVCIGLHVFTGNTVALNFYKREGYECGELREGFYGQDLDAFVYTKELNKAELAG